MPRSEGHARKTVFQDVEYTLTTGRSPRLERRCSERDAMAIKVPLQDVEYLMTCSAQGLCAYFVMTLLEEAKRGSR